MKLQDIIKNTAIIGLSAKIILSTPDFSTLNNRSFQIAVAYAESQYVEEVTDETYKEKVYESGKPSLVCFLFGPDLEKKLRMPRYCEYFSAVFEKLAEEYHNQINFFEYRLGKEYVDEARNIEDTDYRWDKLYKKYDVNSEIPTTVMYNNKGNVIDILRGAAPLNRGQINQAYKTLSERWIQTNLTNPNGEWAWRSHGSPGMLKIPYKPEE